MKKLFLILSLVNIASFGYIFGSDSKALFKKSAEQKIDVDGNLFIPQTNVNNLVETKTVSESLKQITQLNHLLDQYLIHDVHSIIQGYLGNEDKLFKHDESIFDLKENETIEVRCLIHLKDNRILTFDDNNIVKIWKEINGKFILKSSFEIEDEEVYGILELKDGTFVSWHSKGKINIWKLEQDRFVKNISIGNNIPYVKRQEVLSMRDTLPWVKFVIEGPNNKLATCIKQDIFGRDLDNVKIWQKLDGETWKEIPYNELSPINNKSFIDEINYRAKHSITLKLKNDSFIKSKYDVVYNNSGFLNLSSHSQRLYSIVVNNGDPVIFRLKDKERITDFFKLNENSFAFIYYNEFKQYYLNILQEVNGKWELIYSLPDYTQLAVLNDGRLLAKKEDNKIDVFVTELSLPYVDNKQYVELQKPEPEKQISKITQTVQWIKDHKLATIAMVSAGIKLKRLFGR